MLRTAPLRRLTALLAAAALALAAALTPAAPARAQDTDDLVRFLLGVAAIAVIVRAIDDNHTPSFIAPRVLPDSCLESVRVRGRTIDLYNARCLRRAGYRNLPEDCLVSLRTSQGERWGYEVGCLYSAGYRPQGGVVERPVPDTVRGILPRVCEMTYRTGGARLTGYDGLCLADEGFRSLPRRCERVTREGEILFDGQCLWDAGYARTR